MTGIAVHRRKIVLAALFSWLVPVLPTYAQSSRRTPQDHVLTLRAFVDSLLPAEDLTPAASALGVEGEILALVEGSEPFTRLFVLVCDWLDQIGPASFAALPPADRPWRLTTCSGLILTCLRGGFSNWCDFLR